MDEDRFWKLIDESRAAAGGDVDEQCRVLEDRLAELAPDQIPVWDAYFSAWVGALALEKLWGAAYLFNGGCSDDGFEYFRRWVVGQGREVAVAAMHDPDSLAEQLAGHDEGVEAEGMAAAWEAYERATGETLPLDSPAVTIDTPAVEDWEAGFDFEDDHDELERRLPRIAELARAHGDA